MKISKLFHWLYAFLMMLPVFALGSVILINTFNMRTKGETRIVYKYETNEISEYGGNADLVIGNVYHIDLDYDRLDDFDDGTMEIRGYIVNVDAFDLDVVGFYTDEVYIADIVSQRACIMFDAYFGGFHDLEFYFFYPTDDSYLSDYVVCGPDLEASFDFIFYDFAYTDGANDYVSELVSSSSYNEIADVLSDDFSGRDVFYEAIEDVRTKPIFSWSYDSFLVAPFQYIMVLFGMPSNHVVVELLSYWLSISIIWLVFDLIMYVPLLAHRWLDKGIIE